MGYMIPPTQIAYLVSRELSLDVRDYTIYGGCIDLPRLPPLAAITVANAFFVVK